MKSEKEIYAVMDMIKPYLDRIAKDIDEGTAVQFALYHDGSGWGIIYEQNKDVVYRHNVDLTTGANAVNWHVEHEFIDGRDVAYHEGIENTYNAMVCT